MESYLPGLARAKICRRSVLYGKWRFELRAREIEGSGTFLPWEIEKRHSEGCTGFAWFSVAWLCLLFYSTRARKHTRLRGVWNLREHGNQQSRKRRRRRKVRIHRTCKSRRLGEP